MNCHSQIWTNAHTGYAVTLVEDGHGSYDSPDGGPTAREIAKRVSKRPVA